MFASVDDDGGSASDTLAVAVVGNNDKVRSKGYWTHQYRGNGKTDFDAVELVHWVERRALRLYGRRRKLVRVESNNSRRAMYGDR